MIGRALLAAWLACLPVALGACASDPRGGYAFASSYREDVGSVAVPIFDNATFHYGLEFALTEAIIKEIHRTTPWAVASPDRADTTLTGSITDAELRKLSTSGDTGLVQEMAVEMTVAFQWKMNRTGEILVVRRNFKAAEPFVPARGAQERLEFGERSAVDQMAREIVAELRSSW